MSELVWNPEQPEGAATEVDNQISEPHDLADDIQSPPLTRRQLRERRERQTATATATATATLAELGFSTTAAAAARPAEPVAALESFETLLSLTPQPATVPGDPVADADASEPTPNLRPRSSGRSRQQRRRRSTSRPATRPRSSAFSAFALRPKSGGRAMLAKLMSFGAMVGVAGMLVATSVPANAFHPETLQVSQLGERQEEAKAEVQVLDVHQAEELAAKAAEKDEYTVFSLSDQLHNRYGNQVFSFTNNPNGTIQWPFATSVPIASGFGARVACSYCSSQHMGVDFTPGLGAPIQSIADGVVNDVIVSRGGLGVHVLVDHVINGRNVQTVYAHMVWGSPAVAKGQAVRVGQYLGDVGSTGASTGPHLHLEIHVEGSPVDPFVWLKANAN